MTRDAMFDPDGPQSAFRRLRRCRAAAAAAAAASAAAGFFITTPGATVLCRNSNWRIWFFPFADKRLHTLHAKPVLRGIRRFGVSNGNAPVSINEVALR